jgi:DNA-binding NtrC family response regulator
MELHCRANDRAVPRLAEETLELMRKYLWPENIRELANIIERATLLCLGDTLLPSHLFFDEDNLEAQPAGRYSNYPAP